MDKQLHGLNNAAHRIAPVLIRFRTILMLIFLGMLCYSTYWGIIGYSLDSSIRLHTLECERHLADPNKERCVVAFVPVKR